MMASNEYITLYVRSQRTVVVLIRAPKFDKLKSLLVESPDRPDVVFFGEGNFTFTLAFATLRNSVYPELDFWQGIISTRYEPLPEPDEDQLESIRRFLIGKKCGGVSHNGYEAYEKALMPDYPASDFNNLKLKTIRACIHNGEKLKDSFTDAKAQLVVNAWLPNDPTLILRYGVDATNIPDDLPVRQKAVWFQCPWIYQSSRGREHKTCELMKLFLRQMASKQAAGDYVLIGIVEHKRYIQNYRIDELLTDVKSASHYEFLGVDGVLVKEVLKYGYHHQTGPGHGDIHNDILNYHLTLVFQRQ